MLEWMRLGEMVRAFLVNVIYQNKSINGVENAEKESFIKRI